MKKHFVNRMKIIGLIFALVGWVMLIGTILERVFAKDLSRVELFFESGIFKWGIKIGVILLLITLIKGQNKLYQILNKHGWLMIILKTVIVVGVIGWIVGLGGLVI